MKAAAPHTHDVVSAHISRARHIHRGAATATPATPKYIRLSLSPPSHLSPQPAQLEAAPRRASQHCGPHSHPHFHAISAVSSAGGGAASLLASIHVVGSPMLPPTATISGHHLFSVAAASYVAARDLDHSYSNRTRKERVTNRVASKLQTFLRCKRGDQGVSNVEQQRQRCGRQ